MKELKSLQQESREMLRFILCAPKYERAQLLLLEKLEEKMHQAESRRAVLVHEFHHLKGIMRVDSGQHGSRKEAFL